MCRLCQVLRRLKRGLLAGAVFAAVAAARAQSVPPHLASDVTTKAGTMLKVGIAVHAPFVFFDHRKPTGFGIELWEKIADTNGWKYQYIVYPTIQAGLDAVAARKCDVMVSDTSITSDRLKSVDFSQPFFRSGFQIMVVDSRPRTFGWLMENVKEFLSLDIVWVSVAAIAGLTLLVTWFERKHNRDFPKNWGEGFMEAFTYVISTALTGKSNYKGFPGVAGRLVLVAWMLLGMLMVAYVTSTITTTMTLDRLQGHITGPQDLPNHTIGVLDGTLAVNYAVDHQIEHIAYPNIEVAVQNLVGGNIDAIVAEAAELEYYDNNNPDIPITEVGAVFEPRNFGFAVPKDDLLRFGLDTTLVLLIEQGYVHDLGLKYFGDVYRL